MLPQKNGAERRRFTRINFDTQVVLHQGQSSWNVNLIDISLKGLLVSEPEQWKVTPNKMFDIQLILNKEHLQLHMEGKLVHIHERKAGFVICHIDLDSMAHLRRLMELNCGNSELINRELELLD